MSVVTGRFSVGLAAALGPILLAGSAAAQEPNGVTGFRLPPSPGSASAEPEAQGPAAEDVPQPRTPPTQAPPTPTPAAPPVVVPPPVSTPQTPDAAPGAQRPTPVPARQTPPVTQPPGQAAANANRPTVPATASTDVPGATAAPFPAVSDAEASDSSLFGTDSTAAAPAAGAASTTSPVINAPAATDPQDSGNSTWLIALAGLVAVLGAAGFWWWRKHAQESGPAHVPVLVRPVVPPRPQAPDQPATPPQAAAVPAASAARQASPLQGQPPIARQAPLAPPPPARPVPPMIPAPSAEELAATKALVEAPAVADAPEGTVHFTVEARKFSLTLVNAVLAYTVEITNPGTEPLENLAIYGDMMGGSGAIPQAVLFEGPAGGQPPVHRIEVLEPGETRALRGEFRVGLATITPIRQGTMVATLPLARFRLEDAEEPALPRIFAVGDAGNGSPTGEGAPLTPFRLDQGPRIFNGLTLRQLA